jgi:hypothetical protein
VDSQVSVMGEAMPGVVFRAGLSRNERYSFPSPQNLQ